MPEEKDEKKAPPPKAKPKEEKKEAGKEGEGAPVKLKKKGKKVWEHYEQKGGELVRKNKNCPKCGQGYLLAAHSDRVVCGKCGYSEMHGKPAEAPKEEKPKEEKPKEEKKE